MFELLHGWVGLLVEANPLAFAPSFTTGRKTWQVVSHYYDDDEGDDDDGR